MNLGFLGLVVVLQVEMLANYLLVEVLQSMNLGLVVVLQVEKLVNYLLVEVFQLMELGPLVQVFVLRHRLVQ